jgi:hypothetical protein
VFPWQQHSSTAPYTSIHHLLPLHVFFIIFFPSTPVYCAAYSPIQSNTITIHSFPSPATLCQMIILLKFFKFPSTSSVLSSRGPLYLVTSNLAVTVFSSSRCFLHSGRHYFWHTFVLSTFPRHLNPSCRTFCTVCILLSPCFLGFTNSPLPLSNHTCSLQTPDLQIPC